MGQINKMRDNVLPTTLLFDLLLDMSAPDDAPTDVRVRAPHQVLSPAIVIIWSAYTFIHFSHSQLRSDIGSTPTERPAIRL